jgi:hypothetical protein
MIKEAPNHVALLMDCSTDNFRRRAYINYKLHYCTEDFKLEVLTLKTSLFHHPHTAIRIRDDIEATIAEFGLKEKRLMAVSDLGGAAFSKNSEDCRCCPQHPSPDCN